MNGEDKLYWNERIGNLEKEILEVKKDVKSIFSIMQCDVHQERMINIQTNLRSMWAVVVVMMSSMIGGFWWLVRQ